jgi:hypothetical protein
MSVTALTMQYVKFGNSWGRYALRSSRIDPLISKLRTKT